MQPRLPWTTCTMTRCALNSLNKQPRGRDYLLPFQQGILRASRVLRGLHADLQATHPECRYLMSAHLNLDCMENLFSQLRHLCGDNTNPDVVEARARLRILLMAPSTLAAVSGGRAVELDAGTSFLSTGLE